MCLNVVADEREIFFLEPLRPNRVTRNEDWDVVDQGQAGFQCAPHVETRGLFRTDREVIDHDLSTGLAHLRDDPFTSRFLLERLKGPEWIVLAHVCAHPIEHAAHSYDRAGLPDFFAKDLGAIRRSENRL